MGTLAPIAQLDRALASGAKGCRFESCWAHHRVGWTRALAEDRKSSSALAVSIRKDYCQPPDEIPGAVSGSELRAPSMKKG
jgi:hypothetical protein